MSVYNPCEQKANQCCPILILIDYNKFCNASMIYSIFADQLIICVDFIITSFQLAVWEWVKLGYPQNWMNTVTQNAIFQILVPNRPQYLKFRPTIYSPC